MSELKSKNITWSASEVTRRERERTSGHHSVIVWLTGLSGAGKSSIVHRMEQRLMERGAKVYVLDGDNLRHGLNSDLGFTPEERIENIRRVGEVAKLFLDAGLIVLCAFISPLKSQRRFARDLVEAPDFVEVYVRASLSVCEARDPKGLYRKAREGKIRDLTGIDAPYEPPEAAEVVVDTERQSVDESTDQVLSYLARGGYLLPP